MNKKLIPLLLLVLVAFQGRAQRDLSFWESGLYVGSLNYSGELTESGGFSATINETRPQFGIFLKRNFTPKFNLGVELGYGRLFASDANHGNADRGFEMKTSLLMTNLTMDLNFKKFGKSFRRNSNTPYITASFGALVFQPELKTGVDYTGYELHKGSDYTSNFMVGFGWKWTTGRRGILGLSLNYHFTGTPHLEGFTQEGVSSPNDSF